MPQLLANIVLKISQVGSTVAKKYVTPAEVMFLVADHHSNAGGDPIVKLELIPENFETEQIALLQVDLTSVEKAFSKLEKADMTEELREQRTRTLTQRQEAIEDQIRMWKLRQSMRNASPSQERARLAGFYGSLRIGKFYPGPIPSFPQTFEEARGAGTSLEAPSFRLLTVGVPEGQPS